MIFIVPYLCEGQKNWFIKLNMNPRFSWSNDEASKINPTNSFSANIGFGFSKKISAETGIYLNRVGFRLKRRVESIGVIDGFNTYHLEGDIPVKQNFTEKFIGIPFQLNYNILKRNNFKLFGYSNLTINLYNRTYEKWWYYYRTADEFTTKNTFTFNGRQKLSFGYEAGVFFERNLKKEFSLLIGINYFQLFHETKFPLKAKEVQFFNLGGILGLRYDFKRNRKSKE